MKLQDKIKFALDECRILILGGQVLVGFGYQAILQPRFPTLPAASQYLQLVSLALMLAGLAIVMSPAARDRLAERGEASEPFHRFTTRMAAGGLAPFVVALAITLYIAVRTVAGVGTSVAVAAGVMTMAAAFWCWSIASRSAPRPTDNQEQNIVELKDKIDHALTESRMVLPGVQAMLGFQFVGTLTAAFQELPRVSQYLHVVCLCLTAVAVVLLIAPAAFHRIAEHGEATERQHRVTTRFLLAAMIVLPPAMTGDLLVVVWKVTDSSTLAITASAIMLLLFYSLWLIPGLVVRSKSPGRSA